MSWDSELAKLFKDRNNKYYDGVLIGKVVKDFPDIKISIYSGEILLNKEKLYFTDKVLDDTKPLGENTILKIDDEVMLIPTSNSQEFFIIDKVRKLV